MKMAELSKVEDVEKENKADWLTADNGYREEEELCLKNCVD